MRTRKVTTEDIGKNTYTDVSTYDDAPAAAHISTNGTPAAPAAHQAAKGTDECARPKSAAELYSGPAFLPPSAAARVLGIGESTCRKWCYNGTLPAVRTGVKYLIPMKQTLDMLERRAAENCRYMEV